MSADRNARLRPDGLAIIPGSGGSKVWWCWVCHGKNPRRKPWVQVTCESLAYVFTEWDEHKVDPLHQDNLRTHQILDHVVEAIGS